MSNLKHNLLLLHRLAKTLHPFRQISVGITFFALASTIYCLLNNSSFALNALEPSLIATLWGLMLYSFIHLFQTLPPVELPHDSFIKKISVRIKMLGYAGLAMIVVTTTVLLFWFSLRLLLL